MFIQFNSAGILIGAASTAEGLNSSLGPVVDTSSATGVYDAVYEFTGNAPTLPSGDVDFSGYYTAGQVDTIVSNISGAEELSDLTDVMNASFWNDFSDLSTGYDKTIYDGTVLGAKPSMNSYLPVGASSVPVLLGISDWNGHIGYVVDGGSVSSSNSISIYEGFSYSIVFDTNTYALSDTPDGTHGGGTKYNEEGVFYLDSGAEGRGIVFLATDELPNPLYYYDEANPNKGGKITIVNAASLENAGGGASAFADLTDVDTSAVVDGSFIEYNETTSKYETTTELRPTALAFNSVTVEKAGTEASLVQADYDITPVVISPAVSLMRYIGGGALENMKASQPDEGRYGELGINASSPIEWALYDANEGDVTSLSYETQFRDLDIALNNVTETDPASIAAHNTFITSNAFVLYDQNSEKYWKFEFSDWTYWSENYMETHYLANAGEILPIPSFSYTRTEYSDPSTDTLDPTTAVTITVTDSSNSDTIDEIYYNASSPTDSVYLYRGYSSYFGNPMNDQPEGQWNVYDSAADSVVWRSSQPYGCEMAVVNEWTDILDPNTKWSLTVDDAFGGGVGNKIVGSKLAIREIESGTHHGLAFTAWTSGGNGSGWAADYVELDATVLTGIIFTDGTVQTTAPGDVSYNRQAWEDLYGQQTNIAPLVFAHNPGITNGYGTTDNSQQADPETISYEGGYGLSTYTNQYGNLQKRLQLSEFYGVTALLYNTEMNETHWYSYAGTMGVSYTAFPINFDRMPKATMKLLGWGSANQIILKAPTADMTRSYGIHGTYKTIITLGNDRTSGSAIVSAENNHIDMNGFTFPTVAPGQEWVVEIQTINREPKDPSGYPQVYRRVVDVYQIV